MRLEETSSENYSDSSLPSHMHIYNDSSSLDPSAFNSRTLCVGSEETGTGVNNSTQYLNTAGEGHDARLGSDQRSGDSPGSVDDCVNSFDMQQDRDSSEQIPMDLPQLPLSMYSIELHDLKLEEDGAATEGNHLMISEGQDSLSLDKLHTDNTGQNEVSQSVVLTQSGSYQPTVSVELLSFSGINSTTERRVFPTEDINKEMEIFSGAKELQSEDSSGYGEMTAVGQSLGENGISKSDRDFPIAVNEISQTAKSISDSQYATFSLTNDSATDLESQCDLTTYGKRKTTTGPDCSIISKIDDNHEHGNDELDRTRHEGRVDIASLSVMKNPLQKAGRHTVIRGKLADDHPFSIAADRLGYKLVSKENNGRTGSGDKNERRKHFMHDLKSFLKEIGNRHFKIPVIGGGDLDIYLLTREVMLLGGVHNVVRKRAFRIVAQQLGIPKTCTSAASVLKGAYERLLFHYEQRLVFGKWPENPTKAVNMKERVCQEKMKERGTRGSLQTREKRKADKSLRHQQLVAQMDVAPSGEKGNMTTFDSQTRGIPNRADLVALATEETSEHPFELPTWAQYIPNEEGYEALIEAAQSIDATNVRNGNEAVLIAMAECFDIVNKTKAPKQPEISGQDLCLAQAIFGLPANMPSIRKAQGFLFNILAMATSAPGGIALATNKSAQGLVEGLLNVLREFHQLYLQSEAEAPWAVEDPLPFNVDHDERMRQDIAQAYCALRVLAELSRKECNRACLFLRRDLLQVYTSFLSYPRTHRTCVISILETLANGSSLWSSTQHPENLLSLLKALLAALKKSATLDTTSGIDGRTATTQALDFEISRKVLQILCTFSPEWGVDGSIVPTFMTIVARLLFEQHKLDALEAVAELACNLATAYPSLAAAHATFIPGVLQLLHSGKCLDFAVETLCTIHTGHPLHAHKEEMRSLCEWQLLSDTQVHSLSKLLEDVVMSPNKLPSQRHEAVLVKREASEEEDNDHSEGLQNEAIPTLSLNDAV